MCYLQLALLCAAHLNKCDFSRSESVHNYIFCPPNHPPTPRKSNLSVLRAPAPLTQGVFGQLSIKVLENNCLLTFSSKR